MHPTAELKDEPVTLKNEKLFGWCFKEKHVIIWFNYFLNNGKAFRSSTKDANPEACMPLS